MEQRKTTVKTEIKNGKKIVTTTTIATTDLNPMNLDEPQGAFLKCPVELPVTIAPKTKHTKGDFQRKALERHNYYRFLHGVPPLEWCSKCASKAQAYANHLAKTQSLEHSHDKSWGENLFTSTGSREPVISADAAVDSWYNEVNYIKNYTDPSPSNFYETGHFTQLVWKDTTHVGMAYAVNGNNAYIVANYLPPGNLLGKFPENVFPRTE